MESLSAEEDVAFKQKRLTSIGVLYTFIGMPTHSMVSLFKMARLTGNADPPYTIFITIAQKSRNPSRAKSYVLAKQENEYARGNCHAH